MHVASDLRLRIIKLENILLKLIAFLVIINKTYVITQLHKSNPLCNKWQLLILFFAV